MQQPNTKTSSSSDTAPKLKITGIFCVPLVGESPKGGWTVEIKPEDTVHALIAIHTEDGISGYGSVFTDGRLATAGLSVLEPMVLGENALEPTRLTEFLHQNTFWMGRGGTLTHVISGINIALWDILGKYTKLPVSTLLGGRHKERVKPYCSLLMDDPDPLKDTLLELKAQGYKAFKIGWGPFGRRDSFKSDEDIIIAARDVLPADCELFVDAGGSDGFWPNGLNWAVRTADMLSNYDVGWFEEALQPDDLEGFASLRGRSMVPITGGEVLTRRQSFLPFLRAGAFDIVQPDVTKVGGISEQVKIYEMANQFGVAYVGHGWNTALGLAADLQMASAFPNTNYVEYIAGSAYVDGILSEQFQLDEEGYLPIPSKPGLGIDLEPERVASYVTDMAGLRLN